MPNPPRWALFAREAGSGTLEDARYKAVHDHVLPAVRMLVEGLIETNKLDAIVYPTSSRRPGLIAGPADPSGTPSATNIANLTGFPDLIVPAGFTSDRLPVGLSFFGPAFSEGEAAGARLQLRAGVEGTTPAGAHAGAAGGNDHGAREAEGRTAKPADGNRQPTADGYSDRSRLRLSHDGLEHASASPIDARTPDTGDRIPIPDPLELSREDCSC